MIHEYPHCLQFKSSLFFFAIYDTKTSNASNLTADITLPLHFIIDSIDYNAERNLEFQ